MKRADQHNVSAHSPVKQKVDPEFLQTEQTGIDMPSEKEIPLPEQQDAPTMGALPVDSIGSLKQGSQWKTGALDETHEDKGDCEDENPNADHEIIATGAGPDPEHTDN